jgi:hypothetical protein
VSGNQQWQSAAEEERTGREFCGFAVTLYRVYGSQAPLVAVTATQTEFMP